PRPTQAAGSQPIMILALIIAVLLLAAFYFNKKQRPEPKSFSYVARQKKRL
ncbi:hypothetical protein H0N96_00575, partial [Candidatus Micrarchaeota archaeon]|nr:hypothetical protein [Candidatus Micrarchaeota archaeon]